MILRGFRRLLLNLPLGETNKKSKRVQENKGELEEEKEHIYIKSEINFLVIARYFSLGPCAPQKGV